MAADPAALDVAVRALSRIWSGHPDALATLCHVAGTNNRRGAVTAVRVLSSEWRNEAQALETLGAVAESGVEYGAEEAVDALVTEWKDHAATLGMLRRMGREGIDAVLPPQCRHWQQRGGSTLNTVRTTRCVALRSPTARMGRPAQSPSSPRSGGLETRTACSAPSLDPMYVEPLLLLQRQ